MTIQTLYTAATGMKAMETKLDVIANNMANVNTTAFKKDRANFEDLFYRQYRLPGAQDADGDRTSTGIEVGLGVRTGSTQTDYAQGAFQTTHGPLDWRSRVTVSSKSRIPTATSSIRGPETSGSTRTIRSCSARPTPAMCLIRRSQSRPDATGIVDHGRRASAVLDAEQHDAADRGTNATGQIHRQRWPD